MYTARRSRLVEKLQQAQITQGLVVLFAALEDERHDFEQDSSFYYFTGITEPGVVLTVDVRTQHTILYSPFISEKLRQQWMSEERNVTQAEGIDQHLPLGAELPGFEFQPFDAPDQYEHLLSALAAEDSMYTCASKEYVQQRFLLLTLGLNKKALDISTLVAECRRKKEPEEVDLLRQAIAITTQGHVGLREKLRQWSGTPLLERELQATFESVCTSSGSKLSFPTIIGSGSNSTVLHYHRGSKEIASGEVIVADTGARYNYYCADLTRTYPVGGRFTERQAEIYTLVLDTLKYVSSLAAPGIWLSNARYPEQSLEHCARRYLREHGGYDKYFPHAIGHYLGLDTHDVGSYTVPLAPGDVIALEPGIYLKEEGFGVRIEDNYLITDSGAEWLSNGLGREIEEVEW